MPFVIDNSVVSGWYIKEQATHYTAAILERLKNDTAHTPALWLLELANVARTSVIRGKFMPEQAADAVALMTNLPITVDRTVVSADALLALALRYNISSYDAAYLDLAMRLQLPIAAKDGALRNAAEAAGVGVVMA